MSSKEKRVVKYYNVDKNNARKEIESINKERAKHYKFYTEREWNDFSNYDFMFNVDKYGVERTAQDIINIVKPD